MGAFSGSMSYVLYFLDEPLAADWKSKYMTAIHHYRLKPLNIESEVERAVGWSHPQYPLETELDLSEVLYTDYLVLGMRIDTWQVPSAMVKLHTDAEVRHIMQTQNKERLNRYEVAEIKERIRLDMKRKTLPMTKCVEMVWHLEQGWVKFFSQSQKLLGEFVDLFEETFQLRLKPHGPFVSATRGRFDHLALTEESLLGLEPESFVDYETMYAAVMEG